MSMYRQLWLALIACALLALAGSLLSSTINTRAYLQQQLQMKNIDNATMLALSLSQKRLEPVDVELQVSALFDSGHYQLIRVTDPLGKTIVERSARPGNFDAPEWFVRMLPINAQPGQALINNGWKQAGKVTVISHSRFVYAALWGITIEMIFALLLACFLGAYLSTLILRRLKRPLTQVIEQARAISERRFITMPEPKVPELRQLSLAMNSAVTRLKTMFEEEAVRLEMVKREANYDTLTGLSNRLFFMAQLRAALDNEESSTGKLVLLRVANLTEINRRIGREETDRLLKTVAKTIYAYVQNYSGGLAGRLNGADFGLLLPYQERHPEMEELLQSLVTATSDTIGNEAIAFIGIGQYSYGQEFSTLLTQVDTALASVEAGGINAICEADPMYMAEPPRSAEQWAHLIRRALEQHWIRLGSFPVVNFSGEMIHRECPMRLMFGGDWLPAGRFFPIAERVGLTAELDLAAVRLGLDELASNEKLVGLAINLSGHSIQDAQFRKALQQLIGLQPRLNRRLWLEVSEYSALAHFDAFNQFCREMAGSGCRLGLEHFGRQFSQAGRLHDLGLDYLKIDASFVRDVESNPGNQSFLKGVATIAHNIGLQVYAEGVLSKGEFEALKEIGFDGATGPAIEEPK